MESTPEVNIQRSTNLKGFAIYGLFGTRDIVLNFPRNVNILLGENGLGKTTVLNAIYYTLSGNITKLNTIVFDKIIVSFLSREDLVINRDDVAYIEDEDLVSSFERRIFSTIEPLISESDKNNIFNYINQSEPSKSGVYLRDIATKLSKQTPFTAMSIHRTLRIMFRGKSGKIEEIKTIIRNEIPEEVLYFPTYRRIEEELHNLGTSRVEFDKKDKRLIQFGMQDVKETLDTVLLSIKNSSIEGFSKITGDMLSQYVDGLSELDFNVKKKIRPNVLKIILDRVGENISDFYKAKIVSIVENGEIFDEDSKYKHLTNFLSKLIDVYDEQSSLDNSIKTFSNVCSKYLYNKQVVYNESKVSINVFQNKNNTDIALKNLSSGEKQIISLFAKIYFDSGPNIIVLFDEPELSLSLEWQRMLLPDVLKSEKCRLLLTVTHSPFVFDNELDYMAEDMNKYVFEK